MGDFIGPYFNFSLSAPIRINGNSSGLYPAPYSTSTTTTSVSTTRPFYYTTLSPNSVFLPDDDYDIRDRDEMGGNNNNMLYKGSGSVVGGDNHDGTSPGRANGLYFNDENGTIAISDCEMPMEFCEVDETAWPRIYAYSAVFIVSAIANLCELVWVCKRLRARASPVNRLFLHLCIADLIVVFMVALVEVLWRISIGWYAGNFMCKLFRLM